MGFLRCAEDIENDDDDGLFLLLILTLLIWKQILLEIYEVLDIERTVIWKVRDSVYFWITILFLNNRGFFHGISG